MSSKQMGIGIPGTGNVPVSLRFPAQAPSLRVACGQASCRTRIPTPVSLERYLAAKLAHISVRGSEAVFQAVLFGFVQNSQAEKVGDGFVAGSLTERAAQIDFPFGHQTGTQLTVGGEAQTVAGGAHVVGDLT